MATYLYRLGRWVARRRWTVLTSWIVVLALVGVGGTTLSGETSDSFSIPGTEAQEALDLLNEKFPGSGGASARIVFAAPEGQTLAAAGNRQLVDATLADAASAPEVVAVSDPFQAGTIAPDGDIGFADVSYAVSVDKLEEESKEALEEIAEPARDAGLAVEFSGGVIAETEGGGETEVFGMAIAFVILFITFGAFVAAGLPILTAAIGVGVTLLGIQTLSGVIELSSTAPTLAIMIGLAVGIDYALFILSRHRQQLIGGMGVEESIGRANATAGSAVIFAGLTVVIALVGLSVVGIPFLTVMGLGAAAAVIVAVLIAITLVPALMAFAGARLGKLPFWRRGREPRATSAPTDGPATRWTGIVTRYPVAVLLVAVAALGVISIPVLDMRLGLPDASQQAEGSTQREAFELLNEGFGPGFSGPLTIVVDAGSQDDPAMVAQLTSEALGEFEGVAAASPPALNEAGDVAIISVTPTTGPASSETNDLVSEIRERADAAAAEFDVDVLVTGTTAINIDVSDKLSAALPLFLLVIVGLAMVLLTLVFRSLLVPVKAVAGFLLTIGASLGIVVWVFQQGNLAELFGVASTGPIVSFLPILLVGILFGLAMDYEVFLVTRMREDYVKSNDPVAAITEGFRASGKVVAVAALIMISVFGGFIFGPDAIIKSIGLALAFGVLVDAFVVRMTIVPAVLALVGHKAWWLPKRLDDVLPNVDIEGEDLDRQINESTVAATEAPVTSST